MEWKSFLFGSVLMLGACDRGATVYERAEAEEKVGDADSARGNFLVITKQFPDSKRAEDARLAFVRLTLGMAQQAVADSNFDSADWFLAEAQPLVEGSEGAHFKSIQNSIRDGRNGAREVTNVRRMIDELIAAAQAEAAKTPDMAKQSAGPWANLVLPGLKPAQQALIRLGKDASDTHVAFKQGVVQRFSQGQYAVTVTRENASKGEAARDLFAWYVQDTPYGWKLVCAQTAGAGDCKDPWIYKTIDPAAAKTK